MVNKWDLVEKNSDITKKYEIDIRDAISPFKDVPVVFVSSLTKQRIFKAVSTAIEVFKNRKKENTNKNVK